MSDIEHIFMRILHTLILLTGKQRVTKIDFFDEIFYILKSSIAKGIVSNESSEWSNFNVNF